MTPHNSIPPLMMQLGKIDRAHFHIRDMIVFWVIQRNPGIQGLDVANKLGLASRSNVQGNIMRLIKEGFVEDRRAYSRHAVPNILHTLPKGDAFFADLIS